MRGNTSLSLRANIIALACSAAFPTIGNIMTLINAIGTFHAVEAPCIPDKRKIKYLVFSAL